jgi:carbon storage regulator
VLVLTRKIGEEVLIGDSIRVQILEVQGNRVKLGLVAPDEVRFKRGELLDAPPRRRDLVSAGCEAAAGP